MTAPYLAPPVRLNAAQQAAVSYRGGHQVIVAGAGTGKTTTLSYLAAGLLSDGLHPYQIVLLSYTTKAADEIRYRCANLIKDGDLITSGTFHSFAARRLHRYGHLIGLNEFTVCSRLESETLLSYLRKEFAFKSIPQDIKSRQLIELLSLADNTQQPVLSLLQAHSVLRTCVPQIELIYAAYAEYKLAHKQLDYDDLLRYLLQLVTDHPHVVADYRRIMVDEAQDLNRLQLTLLHALIRAAGSTLTAVGDPCQSIYGFRGSEPAVMQELISSTQAQVFHLSENNRSTQPILDVCNKLIGQLPGHLGVQLVSDRQGPAPTLKVYPSDAAEARTVAAAIAADLASGVPAKSIACLYAKSYHGVKLQAELTALSIPYHTCGGIKVAEAAHIRDMLALIRLGVDLEPLAARRVLMLIPGIGEAKAERIVSEGFESAAVPPKSRARVESLLSCIESMRGAQPADAWAAAWAWYQPLATPPQQYDVEQMGLLCASAASVRRFFDRVALQSERGEESGVCLSTVHSAKGRGFHSVYLLGLSEGVFSTAQPGSPAYAESVRLLYVACTRAASTLHLSAPLLCQMPDRSHRQTRPLPHIAFLH